MLLFGWVLSRCFLAPLGVLLVMKTLEDEQYVVIKAYKFTVFEIWRDFNVLSYITCPRYPYIRVYRLYDSLPHSLNYHGKDSHAPTVTKLLAKTTIWFLLCGYYSVKATTISLSISYTHCNIRASYNELMCHMN